MSDYNRDEKRLYQTNKISKNLIMVYVLLNTVHAIITLQNMTVGFYIGLFIMATILVSMTTFLAAVKIETYSLPWTYGAVGILVQQIIKFLLTPSEMVGSTRLTLDVLILTSVVFIAAGIVISFINIGKRTNFLNNHYTGKEMMHK